MSTTGTHAQLVEAALTYARRGWRVVPLYGPRPGGCSCPSGAACEHPGKHPRLREWPSRASVTDAKIQEWFTRWPESNVGIATGAASGVFALDVDPRHGGDEALARLEATHGPLPRTPRQVTGGGGEHVLFRHPGWRIGNQQGEATLAPGLDVRGDGGQIVAAPSRHANGRAYAWDLLHDPADVPLADAPAWLLARLQPTNGNGTGHAPVVDEIIGEGRRNQLLFSLAGSMRRRGMTTEEILGALTLVNAGRCRPPLEAVELRQIAASAGRYTPEPAPPAAERPASRLKVVSWAELTRGEIEPVAYFWPGWISVAAVALMSAAGESLKSWLAAYLACMAAAGRPAFAEPGADEAPVQSGPVLYLAGENALAEERRRCQLLKAGLELPDDLPITFVDAGGVSLSDPEDYAAVVALVAQLRPVLIVLDSAIALSGLARENDNTEVRAFMKTRILPLARTHGATVLLIGHSPKAPTQPGVAFGDEHVARGAGDWRNAADTLLYLKRDRSLGEFAVVLKHSKQRIGPRHAPIWFELQEPEPGRAVRLVYGGRFSEAAQGIQAGVQKAVATAAGILKAAPAGLFQRDLGEQVLAAGISKATYRRALDVLRGRKPWPYGPLRDKTQAVVTEVRHGKHVHLTVDLTTWPADEDWDDAA